jgi:glycosyltransferase involved in cell wall biosynthesis
MQPRRIIVIDDGSADGTQDVVTRIKEQTDIELRINQNNLGLVKNWNECIRNCDGDYLLILHSDDWLHPTAISQLDALVTKSTELGLISLGARFFESPIETSCKKWCDANAQGEFSVVTLPADRIAKSLSLICSSVVVARRAYDAVGMFSEQFPFSPDEEMWVRIATRWPIAIRQSAELVAVRSQGEHYMYETWGRPSFAAEWRNLHDRLDEMATESLQSDELERVQSMIWKKHDDTLKWIVADCKSRGVPISRQLSRDVNHGSVWTRLAARLMAILRFPS